MFSSSMATIPTMVFLERKLRDGIRHAKLLCHGHEDTRECKLAWDRVDGIQKAINKKKERKQKVPGDDQCEFDELACREYDI
jgi:hypothetical protein